MNVAGGLGGPHRRPVGVGWARFELNAAAERAALRHAEG